MHRKLYVPIHNLNVDSKISFGDIVIHPASHAKFVIDEYKKISGSQNIMTLEKDFDLYLTQFAFAEITIPYSEEVQNVIPDDPACVQEMLRPILAILYYFQKKIAGIHDVTHQTFGLKNEISNSLNFIAGIDIEQGKSCYKLFRTGIIADWGFSEKSINIILQDKAYNFFQTLLMNNQKNDIEKRVILALLWIRDAALDLDPVNRFLKIAIGIEFLFVIGAEDKGFAMSKFSTLLSHHHVLTGVSCKCPILEAKNHKHYERLCAESGLPGFCSAYCDIRKWYKIRNMIVHDAARSVNKKDVISFEWWAHKFINAVIDISVDQKISTISQLRTHLETLRQSQMNTNPAKC